jgi:hypothetical protein
MRREPHIRFAQHQRQHHDRCDRGAGVTAGRHPRARRHQQRVEGIHGIPGGIDTTARSLLASEQGPDINANYARLTRLGFIRGVRENLSAGATSGLSEVEQFHSAKAASAELAAEIAEDKTGFGGPFKAFAVARIPGARGFTLIEGGQGGINIAFVNGPYYYLVGQELAPSESINAAIASVTAAAQDLYHRVSS